jgi:arylformamidase
MSRKIIDISFLIHEGMTTYPVHWHPLVEITQLGRFGIEDRETRKLVIGTHTGTHCDAPRHFVPGGRTVDELPLEIFIGKARVLNFSAIAPSTELGPEDFERLLGDTKAERLILRFDWDKHWGTLNYYNDHPYISDEAAHWLVDRGVRLLAMDTPQVDNSKNGRGSGNDSPVHKIMLGAGVVFVEYCCNLKAISQQVVDLVVLPLKLKEGDGAPVRAVVIEDDE